VVFFELKWVIIPSLPEKVKKYSGGMPMRVKAE
jgi:hypothetical protein